MRYIIYCIDESGKSFAVVENELVALLIDLMAGGTVPLVELLYNGLGLLAIHPHVQVKLQSELDHFALGQRSPFAAHPFDYGERL